MNWTGGAAPWRLRWSSTSGSPGRAGWVMAVGRDGWAHLPGRPELEVPAGLPIGSHTPNEIAVSVAARLVALRGITGGG